MENGPRSDGVDISIETVFGGAITIAQPARGERVGIDPILLNHVLPAVPDGLAADLGTGTGIIATRMVHTRRAAAAVAVEIMPDMARCAEITVSRNRLEDHITVVNDDLRRWSTLSQHRHRYDLVVSNPPYHPLGRGHVSPDPLKASARHEVNCEAPDLFAAMKRLLKPETGIAAVIYPAYRLAELLKLAAAAKLQPFRLHFLHPQACKPAGRVIVLMGRKPRELEIAAPMILHPESGDEKYLPAIDAVLRGQAVGE